MCVVLFGINLTKMPVLFYNELRKKSVLCGSISLKISVLFDMNSDKTCVVLFCINSLKVSKLLHMNSKIIQLLFSRSCILVNLFKTEAVHSH